MKILVSGSNGLVGKALVETLKDAGHSVSRLVRSMLAYTHEISWDPEAGFLDKSRLPGNEVVVHLAGESIMGWWTAAKKQKILASRVKGTRLLAEALAKCPDKPRVFISASAVGYYGDRGNEVLKEESPSGTGFLADVCRQWERACEPAAEAGIRVVNFRTGIVMSKEGGALGKMLLPFKMGMGGILGTGKQWMSWIAIDDLVGIISYLITADSLQGPVNAVSPTPVTNEEFTKTLGRVLSRPTVIPMPAFAARLIFGEMADELLLGSSRVDPKKLKAAGYPFHYQRLEEALKSLLGR